jgi:hypothetical protein
VFAVAIQNLVAMPRRSNALGPQNRTSLRAEVTAQKSEQRTATDEHRRGRDNNTDSSHYAAGSASFYLQTFAYRDDSASPADEEQLGPTS